MNIIEIVFRNNLIPITITTFTNNFGKCDYSFLSTNQVVQIQFFFGQAKKVSRISAPLFNSPEKSVKQFDQLN